MSASRVGPPTDRSRLGWWAFVFALAVVAGFVAYSFVGMAVLGVFGYYATRPIYRRLERRIEADGIAAGATVLLIVVPLLALLFYAGFNVVQQVQQAIGTVLALGTRALGAVAGGIVLIGLALAFSYSLLENDDRLGGGLEALFGGRDTVAYAYAAAVDEDLESVFFGNLLFVLTMAVIAAITYGTTNLLHRRTSTSRWCSSWGS